MMPRTTRVMEIRSARALGDTARGPFARGVRCLPFRGHALVGMTIGGFSVASLWTRMFALCAATTPYLHAAQCPAWVSFTLDGGRSGKCTTHGSSRLGALSDYAQLVARSPVMAVHRAVSSMPRSAKRNMGDRPGTIVHHLARELGGIRYLRDHPLHRGRCLDRIGNLASGPDTAASARDRSMALVARDPPRDRAGYGLYVGKRVDQHHLAALAVFDPHADNPHRRDQGRPVSTSAMAHDPAACDPHCTLASESRLTDHEDPPRRRCGHAIGSTWGAARRVERGYRPTPDRD